MNTPATLAASLAMAAAYWCTLLNPAALDPTRATVAALATFPVGAAIVAAWAGKRRRLALRVSFVAAALLPVLQLVRFEPTLLESTLCFATLDTTAADRAGAMALAALAICLAQIAAMAVLTMLVHRLITPPDRLSR